MYGNKNTGIKAATSTQCRPGSTAPLGWKYHITLSLSLGLCGSRFMTVGGSSFIGAHPPLQDVSIMFLERRLDESNSNYYKITSHSCSFHSPHVAVDDILSFCPTCSSHPPAYKSKDKLPFETLRCSHPKSMIQAGGS